MKVLFAVSNENISTQIVKKFQKEYKEIISYKNMYYFNAIVRELQRDKSYDRIVISEDLEPFATNNYDEIEKFIFEKLDNISDEATGINGNEIPIILLATDKRTKSDSLLVKLFGIGIYNVLLGQDRSTDKVCELLNKPRNKKEAKIYYKIEADEVSYKSESEDHVSEAEIKNILNHYKRLGKDEERYIESFNNIAAQYNDAQLRIITKFLPLNVKAVLEEQSPKYQSVMTFGDTASTADLMKQKKEEEGLKVGFLNYANTKKPTEAVIVPTAVKKVATKRTVEDIKPIRKNEENTSVSVEDKENDILPGFDNLETEPILEDNVEDKVLPGFDPIEADSILEDNIEDSVLPGFDDIETDQISEDSIDDNKLPGFDDIETETMSEDNVLPGFNDIESETILEENKMQGLDKIENIFEETEDLKNNETVQPVKRGRGRPRKIVTEEEKAKVNVIKRGRGRPRKVQIEPEVVEETALPIDNEPKEMKKTILPGFGYVNEDILPDFGQTDDTQNMIEEEKFEEDNFEEDILPGLDYIKEKDDIEENNILPGFDEPDLMEEEHYSEVPNTVENAYTSNIDISNLLTKDKKVVSFVGTTKNGTSFMVNNLAKCLSGLGIKTAILDLTTNRNSYYIYTKNEEKLRKVAYESINKLKRGVAEGITVDHNLDVYTALPGDKIQLEHVEEIISTLVKNYSIVLIDCDFNTPAEYFDISQEIYVVQTMDILTIQPMTAFLRDLKAKEILKPEKLRIVINKEIKIKGLTQNAIIGGLAYYNDPAMSFMTELFNKDTIKHCTIPFEEQVCSKYLEGVMNCEIKLSGYSKTFNSKLKQLANMVYPLLGNKNSFSSSSNKFSVNINDTLEKMKNRY